MLQLRTLGGLSLSRDGSPLSGAAAQRRRLAVLAVLGAAGERGISRDRLLALLWPERDHQAGRQALSQALYALRRDSGDEPLVHGAGSEDLRLDLRHVQVDLLAFEEALARSDWSAAAALYNGPFLDGIHLDGDDGAFERWVEERRARAQAGAEQAFEQLALAADGRGDHAVAAQWWRRLTAIDPLRTRAAAGLIQSLAEAGDRSGAIRYAESYAAQVREELDAEPNPRILELTEALRTASRASSLEATDAAERIGGRYVVEREIGRGGMAVVSLARDLRHDREVALKMLHPELGNAADRERMLREIRVTARLQHPHILPLYDSGEHAGQLYYVMPFVAGDTLRTRLQRDGVLPLGVALRFGVQVADALDYAHQQGIVHRDIKPENILLTPGTRDGESHAIVADFGIVQLMAAPDGDRLTRPFMAVGTPAYMSPEQIMADGPVDARTDVYALGCVLYEMLAGRPPWIAKDAQALLSRLFVTRMPSLREVAPAVPPAVAQVVDQAIRQEADERFASAGALARALERATATAAAAPDGVADLILPPLPPMRSLVGRERACETARALLLRDDVRLVTLTGAGGSGKTSLAERIAHEAVEQFDGIALIDLSAVTDPQQVIPTIASVLGVREREQRGVTEALATALRPRRLLLVLDNLEQVVQAAPELSRLLQLVPSLRLLVTSRVRLRVRGEYEFHVAPLAVPLPDQRDGASLTENPAVALFLTRAAESGRPGPFDPEAVRAIAALCVRLDGLPLAIELAAARTRLLSPSAILARLDARGLDFLADGAQDLPARQRTLRTTIAWSTDLLSDPARRTLAQLGAFAGPFDLDAAMAVLASDEDAVLEGVQELLEANLIRRVEEEAGEPRFSLLETIRTFARDEARSLDLHEATVERHARHFLGVARAHAARLSGSAQADALAQLERQRAEFQRVLELCSASESGTPTFIALVLALWRGWLVAGHWTEGRGWLQRAIEATAMPGELATLLGAAGTLAQNQGEYAEAWRLQERALGLWRDAGDRSGQARSLAALGWLAWRRCRLAESRALSTEALDLFTAMADEAGIALAHNNLGWIANFQGAHPDALRHYEEALRRRRALGDRRNIAFTLSARAWATIYHGRADEALPLLDEADALFAGIGERQLAAFAQLVRAEALVLLGEPERAYQLMRSACLPEFERIGDRFGVFMTHCLLGDVHRLAGDAAAAAAAYSASEQVVDRLHDHYGRAILAARHASLARQLGEDDTADRHLHEATSAAATHDFVLPPIAGR